MVKDLGGKIQQSAKKGVQKSAAVTTFVGMNSVQIANFLQEKYALQIAQLLPVNNKKKAERTIAQSVLVISQNDSLKECTPQSIIGAIMKAAMYGFNPNPETGQCWFIPYKNSWKDEQGNWQSKQECQFQMGARGWVQRLQNTGLVKRIINKAVHIEDEFSEICGSKSEIRHIPCGKQVTWETLRCAYAIIEIILKDSKGKVLSDAAGQPIVGTFDLVMYKPEIDRLRKKGIPKWEPNKDKLINAWVNDAGEMAKAKVLKKLIKDELPHSDEMEDIIESDEQVFDITDANMATKELIPVSTEEPENVEAENMEVLEIVKVQNGNYIVNPETFDDTGFSDWLNFALENPSLNFNEKTFGEIARRVLIGEIQIEAIPNEWVSNKQIENAVLTVEQKA